MRALAAAVAVVVVVGGCHAAISPQPQRETSACLDLGGTVGSDDVCELHTGTTAYTITMRFPSGYPDQRSIGDFLVQRRKNFIDWVVASEHPRVAPAELDVIGEAYESSATRSLVLTLGEDTGVHPVTTYKTFNYSLADHAPITFETFFKPDTDPAATLKPFVAQQALARDQTAG